MSALLQRPRPPVVADRAVDPEALIEEARRRARRRRAAYAGATLLAIGAALGAFFAFDGGTTKPRPSRPGESPRGVPQAASIVGTVRITAQATVLFTARERSLFVLVVPQSSSQSITIERVDPTGIASRRVAFKLPGYLGDVSAGPEGIYAGTSVIKRFTTAPDELIRIDPKTLTVRAHALFPGRVATVADGDRLWASTGDGRVVRLDPRTLTIEASRRILARAATTTGAELLSKPAAGLGSVWVLAGGGLNLKLVRMDPATLAVRSRTPIPSRGVFHQALNQVVGDASHVYVVGSAVVPVDPNGMLVGRPVLVPDLATAAIHGTGLVGLTGGKPALVLMNPHGRIAARTRLYDAGGVLAVSDRDAWFLGNAGQGNGIVHAQLAR